MTDTTPTTIPSGRPPYAAPDDVRTDSEAWLMAFHLYPTDAHSLEALRRFLAYFRVREKDVPEPSRAIMRGYQRQTESAIARHSGAQPSDLALLRLV